MARNDNFRECIGKIESTIGYVFRDKSLLEQAFTRTSFCNEINPKSRIKYQSNEVLEFFGDGVLSASIITFLLMKHAERYEHGIRTRLDEGDFSNIKSKLSDKKNLSLCIKALGLESFLRMGEGDAKLGIENEPSVMEDLFESIIGAVYIDSDMNMPRVMEVVSRMLDIDEYATKEPPVQSAKNALQEYCQDKSRRLPPPRYETLGEEGPDHKKQYRRGVYIGDRLVAEGVGKNLKLADAAAAEAALEMLKKEGAKEEPKKEAPPVRSASKKNSSPKAKPASAKMTTKVDTESETKQVKQPKKKVENSTRPTPKAKGAPKSASVTESKKATRQSAASEKAEKASARPKLRADGSNASPKQSKRQLSAPNASAGPKLRASAPNASAAPKPQPTAAAGLKSHASKKKVATPTFKDLGESREGNKTVYRVECIFMGRSAIGTGSTRLEAKERSARLILDSITPTAKKKKKQPKN